MKENILDATCGGRTIWHPKNKAREDTLYIDKRVKEPGFTGQEVRERDNHECRFCEFDDNLHTHHVIPRKAGGSDSLENLITVCASCHKTIESTQGKALKRLKNELQNNLLQNLDSIVVDKVVHIARSVSIGADRLWYIGCDKEKAISEYKQAERPRLRTAKVTVEIEKEDIKDAVEESLPAGVFR